VVNPKNNVMGSIGTKVIQSKSNIEEHIKTVLGPNSSDQKLKMEQIMDVLQKLHVVPTLDERNHLMEWFR
jgi:hypothetical protein